jgi:hypothetical protein
MTGALFNSLPFEKRGGLPKRSSVTERLLWNALALNQKVRRSGTLWTSFREWAGGLLSSRGFTTSIIDKRPCPA